MEMVNETDTSVAEKYILCALHRMDIVDPGNALSTVEIREHCRLLGMAIDQPTGDTDRLLRNMVYRGLLSMARPMAIGSTSRRARLFCLTSDGQDAARTADQDLS